MRVFTDTPARQAAQAKPEDHLPQGTPPELIAAIVDDAARDIFAKGGPDAFAMPREAAIAHETGHAIVATHEGIAVQSVAIFSRPVWTGWCAWDGQWTSGPDTTAESDLSRARIVIAGLAGEAVCRLDKPGSSLDELALSQLLGCNAASKLAPTGLSDDEYHAYAERLWHERVWSVAWEILLGNSEVFNRLFERLHRTEQVEGGELRSALAPIRRKAP